MPCCDVVPTLSVDFPVRLNLASEEQDGGYRGLTVANNDGAFSR